MKLSSFGRIFVDPITNLNYSMIWEDALSAAHVFSISSSLLAFLLMIYSYQVVKPNGIS